MPFLELTLPCTEAQQPRYERALEDVGALAVTLADAHADAPDEQAIFEPGVGEQPLWGELVLTALFADDTDALMLLAALEAFDDELDWTQARFRKVEDQDWERAWMDQYVPLRFGARTWIVPWNSELPEEAQAADAAIVRLDPGLAFGSGTHPTTALCLQWLDALAARRRAARARVLDFGCGSGILALAALKLGAGARGRRRQRSAGADRHARQRRAQRRRRPARGVPARRRTASPTYPVVVANILASALVALADTLAARVAPGGRIAHVRHPRRAGGRGHRALCAATSTSLHAERLDDWMRVTGTRRRG